jgi:hypothetical protein
MVFTQHFSQRPLSPLSYDEFVRLDVETPARLRHGIHVIHRRRARLKDERPQLGEVLTPSLKSERLSLPHLVDQSPRAHQCAGSCINFLWAGTACGRV